MSGKRGEDAAARKAHEKEVHDLQTQVSFLEEEISVLRRKLAESPRQARPIARATGYHAKGEGGLLRATEL
jgi:hypothetical protein